MDLSPECLQKLEQSFKQFSTAFRSLSKAVVAWGQSVPDCRYTAVSNREIRSRSGTLCPEESDSELEGPDVREWLFSRQCLWGVYHSRDVAIFLQNEKFRADKNKNFWRLAGEDPQNRKHWRKIPQSRVKLLYTLYVDMVNECHTIVVEEKRADSERWQELHAGKRSRSFRIKNALRNILTYKEFVLILKDKHDVLPPLRNL